MYYILCGASIIDETQKKIGFLAESNYVSYSCSICMIPTLYFMNIIAAFRIMKLEFCVEQKKTKTKLKLLECHFSHLNHGIIKPNSNVSSSYSSKLEYSDK